MKLKLAENIKRQRKEHGFTQEQLAEALGVTVGAVYKWENNLSVPEIQLITELAELFDTSVDVLLGYGWEHSTMGAAAEKIAAFHKNRQIADGIRFAEKALLNYPNSFDVVYQSACLFFKAITLELRQDLRQNDICTAYAEKAKALYTRSLALLAQNTRSDISEVTINKEIALCCYYLGQEDEAITLLKKHNAAGVNHAQIGLLLSSNPGKAKEALPHLSDALILAYSQIYNTCIGYANAYAELHEPERVRTLFLWLLEMGHGLWDTARPSCADRLDIRIYTILATVSVLQNDESSACQYLKTADTLARRFDASPEYHIGSGMKYYHGDPELVSFDDMGSTAMQIIEQYIAADIAGVHLQPLWEKIKHE